MKSPLLILCLSLCASIAGANSPRQLPANAKMSWLDNGIIKVGADLNRGGAIVFLAPADGDNRINNFDLGRQIQLSFFSGPVPFAPDGQKPSEHWEHIGWNPIQTGDDFDHPARVLTHRNDGRVLHVTTRPMQWPLENVPGDCTFESWLELEGAVLKARARLNNARIDKTPYPARLQELPALYANAAFHRVVSYTGDRPFTGAATNPVPKPKGTHPWSFWVGTEHWAALLDTEDRGLGLITPGRVHFTGGFAGQPGPNDPFANSTGYLAGQGREVLDHNIVYDFRYEIVVGTLADIRKRALSHRPTTLPAWHFASDRQGWHFHHATDRGWPIEDHLQVRLDQNDPQLLSPYFFVRAKEAPTLILEAAFKTPHRQATLFWQRHEQTAPGPSDHRSFPIRPDGQFHRYTVDLSGTPGYRGGIIRLRLDPVPAGTEGDWMKLKSILFVRP